VSLTVGAPFAVTVFGINSQLLNANLTQWSLEEFSSRTMSKVGETYRCHDTPVTSASGPGWSDHLGPFPILQTTQKKSG
jgi:hypothetical protein